jgi:transcription termination/antitermination protein NusG
LGPSLNPAVRRDTAWYALRVRARSELLVAHTLGKKEFECYVPSWEECKSYSDRVLRVHIPAFPGYAFSRFCLAERLEVVNTPGVQHIVGTGATPEAIEESVISSLRTAFSCARKVAPTGYFRGGNHVRIVRGPLTGATGVLARFKGEHRLIISVDILQRSVSVEVEASEVVLQQPGAVNAMACGRQGL